MFRRLFRLSALLACSALAHAGTCPANVPSGITVCFFVDYSAGADTNTGADEAHPWKYLPGMTGCANNCASNTPAASDGYILKGGSVWPSSAFPLAWLWKGTSSGSSPGCTGAGCIYIGYDPTWNQGTVNSVIITRDWGGCPSSGVTASFSGGGGSSAAASVTTIGGQTNFDSAGYLIAYSTVTNGGSGYTSNPAVTISGSGCNSVQAVADIQRPIFDLGAATACQGGTATTTWNEAQMVTNGGIIQWGGQTTNGGYLIVDHLDIRNAAYNTGAAGNTPLIEAIRESPNVILENQYIHNWCTTQAHGTNGSDGSVAMNVGYNTATASGVALNNIVDNGAAAYTCSPSGSDTVCGYGTAIQVQNGIGNASTFQGNKISFLNWAARGCPGIMSGNEIRGTIASDNGGHTNNIYIGLCGTGAWTTVEYNNLIHDTDAGANSQTTQGNGQIWYIFNNTAWQATGSGTQWGIDTTTGAGATTSNIYFWNNTVVGSAGTGSCFNVNATGPDTDHLNLFLYNNHCITDQAGNHWFSINSGTINTVNGVSSPTNTTADSANVQMTPTTAASQGYSVTSAIGPYAPILNTNSTVTFAGTNLTSTCSTTNLGTLCSDINGNLRPATGNWQAGAYEYTLGGSGGSGGSGFSLSGGSIK